MTQETIRKHAELTPDTEISILQSMRQAEKLRSVLIALTFIFLCGQVYSITAKANFWKSISEQTRESYLTNGTIRPLALPECFSDAHSGFPDDTSSTVFIPVFIPRAVIRIPENYERYSFFSSPGCTCITKYHRSVIAIQTVR
jgi:hypothetical protein